MNSREWQEELVSRKDEHHDYLDKLYDTRLRYYLSVHHDLLFAVNDKYGVFVGFISAKSLVDARVKAESFNACLIRGRGGKVYPLIKYGRKR